MANSKHWIRNNNISLDYPRITEQDVTMYLKICILLGQFNESWELVEVDKSHRTFVKRFYIHQDTPRVTLKIE